MSDKWKTIESITLSEPTWKRFVRGNIHWERTIARIFGFDDGEEVTGEGFQAVIYPVTCTIELREKVKPEKSESAKRHDRFMHLSPRTTSTLDEVREGLHSCDIDKWSKDAREFYDRVVRYIEGVTS